MKMVEKRIEREINSQYAQFQTSVRNIDVLYQQC